MPEGVHLIFSSLAVKTDDNNVMNVTPHIACGASPTFNFVVKSNTSHIDVHYKRRDEEGHNYFLDLLDLKSKPVEMPKINVNGIERQFSFNTILQCKTPG